MLSTNPTQVFSWKYEKSWMVCSWCGINIVQMSCVYCKRMSLMFIFNLRRRFLLTRITIMWYVFFVRKGTSEQMLKGHRLCKSLTISFQFCCLGGILFISIGLFSIIKYGNKPLRNLQLCEKKIDYKCCFQCCKKMLQR